MNVLLLFVEGSDDREFVDVVLRSRLTQFDVVKTVTYDGLSPRTRRDLLSTAFRQGQVCCLLADNDWHPDPDEKRAKIVSLYKGRVPNDKVFIVVQEIESWIAAGISETNAQVVGVHWWNNTNEVGKEEFYAHMGGKTQPAAYRRRYLNGFSFPTALVQNRSFAMFCRALGISSSEKG